jgi:hypothetical protein
VPAAPGGLLKTKLNLDFAEKEKTLSLLIFQNTTRFFVLILQTEINSFAD